MVELGKWNSAPVRGASLVFVGTFLTVGIVLSTLVFPFWNLILEDVFEKKIILKNNDGICYVETSNTIPKVIEDCTLNRVML